MFLAAPKEGQVKSGGFPERESDFSFLPNDKTPKIWNLSN
jgi:hypothetical protein